MFLQKFSITRDPNPNCRTLVYTGFASLTLAAHYFPGIRTSRHQVPSSLPTMSHYVHESIWRITSRQDDVYYYPLSHVHTVRSRRFSSSIFLITLVVSFVLEDHIVDLCCDCRPLDIDLFNAFALTYPYSMNLRSNRTSRRNCFAHFCIVLFVTS